jgi:hypothetical protein
MLAIIGTGPSAFVISSLCDEMGIEYEILDTNNVPNRQTDELKKQWRNLDSRNSQHLLNLLQKHENSDIGNVGKKNYFGDGFSYSSNDRLWQYASKTKVASSAGLGGFSRVWGATLLPFAKSDMQNWPIEITDLSKEIQEIYDLLPVAGNSISQSIHYGRSPERAVRFARDPRIDGLLSSNSFQKIFSGKESEIFESRLALDVSACVPCSSCITGCPRDAIWSSSDHFTSRNRKPVLAVEVTKIVETDDSVLVEGTSPHGHWERKFTRVIISAGPIGTAGILARSGYRSEFKIRDSQTVFLTGFFIGRKHSINRRVVTLSQAFARIAPSYVSKSIHVQVYGWNPTLPERIRKEVPLARLIPLPIISFFSRFLISFIVYFDSEDSEVINVAGKFNEEANHPFSILSIPVANAEVNRLQRLEISALCKKMRHARLITGLPLSRWAGVGEGYHSGASIPYLIETDEYARPKGTSGMIHVLDSSILPNIPSGPITLNVMALTRRIARRVINEVLLAT